MGTTEWMVVILVVGARLFLPFTIPTYPLLGSIACMLLDSIDQSIFQQFPAIPLEGYQSYDKSLDIYYLAIIYTATMRNWTNPYAFKTSFFLYYYRLVGVVAFELTQVRALLFIFPNTFEYFYDFIEAVRLRWDWKRVGKWTAIISAAAHLDLHQAAAGVVDPHRPARHDRLHQGDAVRRERRRELERGGRQPTVGARPGGRHCRCPDRRLLVDITRKAPPADRKPRWKADPLPPECRGNELYSTVKATDRIFDRALLEKIVLTGLISVIFAQYMLPENVRSISVLAFVAVFVILNAAVSQFLARHGRFRRSMVYEAIGMFVVNYAIVLALLIFQDVLGLIDGRTSTGMTAFFVFLFTVITVLFDRYNTVFRARGVLQSRTLKQT